MKLSELISEIKGDLGKNFSLKNFIGNFLFNPGFRILLNHRVGKFCYFNKLKILQIIAARLKYKLISKRGCDISYKAKIGRNLKLPHPIGIVIGDGVVIEDNVMVFQQVTLGSHGKKEKIFHYPIIKSGAKIYTGAKVIGGISVGENAIIGANAVVNIDIPSEKIAVGIPCKIIK